MPAEKVPPPRSRARRVSRRRLLALCVASLALVVWVRFGPLPAGLLDEPMPSTIVVDRHGTPLYEARSDDGTRGIRLSADALPPVLVAATLAAEDRRFWAHPGVDPVAVVRAAKTNLAERSIVEGGSTITQQVAKLLLNRRDPNRTRGWRSKLREAVIALRLEHRRSKREILALYLNLAAYGNQIAGAERASRAYFGRSAAMLTPAQAAFLAGLPQRPSGFNPHRSLAAAVSRQRVVLRRMLAAGALTGDQAAMAAGEELSLRPPAATFTAPHFVEMVLSASGSPRPARIATTLDAELQAEVAGIIESHRPVLRRHGAANVSVVVLDNRTAEWLAWEGSGDYLDGRHGGAINGPLVPRQPGSALKPFTYALAFEEGHSPATVLADVPASFPTAEPGVVYNPRNYDGRYRGPMLARAALAGSENVPAVALAAQVGVPTLLRFLERMGLTTLEKTAAHYGLGLTLGNAEVRLDELTAAYAALARGGDLVAPTWILDGAPRASRRVVSHRTAFWVTDVLSDDEARAFVFGRGGSLEFPFPVAVKTGTSQAYHDNWTIGYSKYVTVGVWVGNFDRTPLHNSSGVTGAAPIFQAVMLAAERRARGTLASSAGEWIVAPGEDVVEREVCALSGSGATAWCPNRRREWLAAEAVPASCNWHHPTGEGVLTVLPPEYDAWRGSPAPAAAPAARTGDRPRSFSIVSPADGATYLIDPTLRREFQTLPLKTVAGSEPIVWRIDGRTLDTPAPGGRLEWPLSAGRHVISARDARGRTAEVAIRVK